MNQEMLYELIRLLSFRDFKISHDANLSTLQLAHDGFYKDSKTRRILCFSCGEEFQFQLMNDLTESAHNPNCRRHELNRPVQDRSRGLNFEVPPGYFKPDLNPGSDRGQQSSLDAEHPDRNDSGGSEGEQNSAHDSSTQHWNNIPVKHEVSQTLDNTHITQVSPEHTETSAYVGESSSLMQESSQTNSATENGHVSDHPVLDLSYVSYPQFSTRVARLATFINWAPTHSHRPEDFAEAGFFYAGYVDCVRCFCCGLGLKFWRTDDIIPYQHARYRPSCTFNRLYKGQEYIDSVSQQNQQSFCHQQSLGSAVFNQTSQGATAVPGNSVDSRHMSSPAAREALDAGWTSEQVRRAVNQILTDLGEAYLQSDILFQTLTSFNTDNTNSESSNHRSSLAESSRNRENSDAVQTSAFTNGTQPSSYEPTMSGRGNDLQNSTDGAKNSQNTTIQTNQKQSTTSQHSNEELRVMEREHSLLAQRTTCRMCQIKPVSCVLLPCGHVATCQECADKISRCVLCDKVIIGTANVYLA